MAANVREKAMETLTAAVRLGHEAQSAEMVATRQLRRARKTKSKSMPRVLPATMAAPVRIVAHNADGIVAPPPSPPEPSSTKEPIIDLDAWIANMTATLISTDMAALALEHDETLVEDSTAL